METRLNALEKACEDLRKDNGDLRKACEDLRKANGDLRKANGDLRKLFSDYLRYQRLLTTIKERLVSLNEIRYAEPTEETAANLNRRKVIIRRQIEILQMLMDSIESELEC